MPNTMTTHISVSYTHLFRNGKEIVTVEDFDDVLLNLDKNEIEILRMIKVIE